MPAVELGACIAAAVQMAQIRGGRQMVYAALTILVALGCAGLATIGFRLRGRTLRVAVVGLAVGYGVGFMCAFALGYLRVSLPSVQIGLNACTSSVWLPAAFGIAGMVIGITAAQFMRPN